MRVLDLSTKDQEVIQMEEFRGEFSEVVSRVGTQLLCNTIVASIYESL